MMTSPWRSSAPYAAALVWIASLACPAQGAEPAAESPAKKIVLFGGAKTHGPGAHEHLKAAQLVKEWIDTTPGLPRMRTQIYLDAWPKDPSELDDAATIVLMWEGWNLHLVNSRNRDRVEKLDQLMRRGVGLLCFHASTAVDDDVEACFLDWVGGNKKRDYSLHPMARNIEVAIATPDHPVCRGVRPMKFAEEEFYCKIFFRPGDRRITPILSAMLPPERPEKQVVAWCCQRADGGRAFACTGLHYLANFQDADFRTLVLNAILWTAKIDVPIIRPSRPG